MKFISPLCLMSFLVCASALGSGQIDPSDMKTASEEASAPSSSSSSSSVEPSLGAVVVKEGLERRFWKKVHVELEVLSQWQGVEHLEELLRRRLPLRAMSYLYKVYRHIFSAVLVFEGRFKFPDSDSKKSLEDDREARETYRRKQDDLLRVAQELIMQLQPSEGLFEDIATFTEMDQEILNSETSQLSFDDLSELEKVWQEGGDAGFLQKIYQEYPTLTLMYFSRYLLDPKNDVRISDFLFSDLKAEPGQLEMKDSIIEFFASFIREKTPSLANKPHWKKTNIRLSNKKEKKNKKPVKNSPSDNSDDRDIDELVKSIRSAEPPKNEAKPIKTKKKPSNKSSRKEKSKAQDKPSESPEENQPSQLVQVVRPGVVNVGGPPISGAQADEIIKSDAKPKIKVKDKKPASSLPRGETERQPKPEAAAEASAQATAVEQTSAKPASSQDFPKIQIKGEPPAQESSPPQAVPTQQVALSPQVPEPQPAIPSPLENIAQKAGSQQEAISPLLKKLDLSKQDISQDPAVQWVGSPMQVQQVPVYVPYAVRVPVPVPVPVQVPMAVPVQPLPSSPEGYVETVIEGRVVKVPKADVNKSMDELLDVQRKLWQDENQRAKEAESKLGAANREKTHLRLQLEELKEKVQKLEGSQTQNSNTNP